MTMWLTRGVHGIGVVNSALEIEVRHCKHRWLEGRALQYSMSGHAPQAISQGDAVAFWLEWQGGQWRVRQISSLRTGDTVGITLNEQYQVETEYDPKCGLHIWKFVRMKWREYPESNDSTLELVCA